MPYIKKEDRLRLANGLIAAVNHLRHNDWTKGEVNYFISSLLNEWVHYKGLSYNTLSDITGVLNDVKTEFERKVVAPYEDLKIKENGEVYEYFKTGENE